jgi:hypothetical protein
VRPTFEAIKTRRRSSTPILPPEAPESRSDKCEAGNAKHSLRDLSSEPPKESLTEISESYDRAKNNGGANQAEKHGAHEVFKKTLSFSAPPKLIG